MPPHISDCFVCILRAFDKLAIIADKVSEVVGASSTICAATTVPPPSQSSSCSASANHGLSRQGRSKSCLLQVAELTRERNSSRHQRYSSDRRRSHSRSRVSIEEVASATIIAVIKSSLQPPVHLCKTIKLPCHSWNGRASQHTKGNPSLISKSASHGTVHHIITTGPPVTARPRRLHPKLYDAVKVEFEFLLAQGIIRPSKSPWSSPLHVVPKSDSYRGALPYQVVDSGATAIGFSSRKLTSSEKPLQCLRP
ncbi:retrovirus-related Pol polyprotein from transposon opus [Trichonephila clavipes]|nr:retrovirus-related Pol polyprotein from transposon opus [Trichonephila clavipes]